MGFNGGRGRRMDLRPGEMGHPGPVKGFLVGEFTYPILPDHRAGLSGSIRCPGTTAFAAAKALYKDYRGAVKYGNIFSLDVGPDYAGKFRKIDVDTLQAVGEMIKHPLADSAAPPKESWKRDVLKQPIRAFCIDFNWHNGRFAEPGHWADADPAAHVKWYKDLGANCIQTFVLSCNGYAWYKGGPIPPQPGLRAISFPRSFAWDINSTCWCWATTASTPTRFGAAASGAKLRHALHASHPADQGICRLPFRVGGRRFEKDRYRRFYAGLAGEYQREVARLREDHVRRADGRAVSRGRQGHRRRQGDVRSPRRGAPLDQHPRRGPQGEARRQSWPNGLHHAELDGVDWLLNEGPDARHRGRGARIGR